MDARERKLPGNRPVVFYFVPKKMGKKMGKVPSKGKKIRVKVVKVLKNRKYIIRLRKGEVIFFVKIYTPL